MTPEIDVATLKSQAAQLLAQNQPSLALEKTIAAKKLRQPCSGLDHIRGLCFMALNRPYDAREAFKEELRFFPDCHDARTLLQQIEKEVLPNVTHIAFVPDQEFKELVEIVRPYTMVWDERLFALFQLAKQVCALDIRGNFVECGVAAGGSSGLLSAVIKRYSKSPRLLYACDSYEGMPAPTAEDVSGAQRAEDTGWGTGTCAASESSVREICTKLGSVHLLRTVKGYFQNTLPQVRSEIGPIAFLHLDGDWYESTRAILQNLYAQVVPGGVMQVDDYNHWEGCRKAIHEFEATQGVRFNIQKMDGPGVWFQKPA